MQDRSLPGFKAAGAAHAAEPVEGQSGHGDGGVALGPLRHREAVELLGIGGAPRLERIHLGHQGGEGPLQELKGVQLRCSQAEALRVKEEMA